MRQEAIWKVIKELTGASEASDLVGEEEAIA